MGGMIGIKPIINMSKEGKMVSIDKAVGRSKALEKILSYVDKLQVDMKNHPIVIAHGNAPHLVDEFVVMLKKRYGDDIKYGVIKVNPTAGCHCGPDVLGIGFHGRER